ncbi:MAG: MarR family transcriptional regulator [Parvibaculum sp.]|nr:MarR family transcriptional regulator [Parvibaculum sp.]
MKHEHTVSALEDHLGYWLRYVSNQVSHSFSQKLARRDVTVAEWVMLREMFEADDLNPSELASKLGLTRGAISKLTDRLVTKALIQRSFSTEDKRFQTLSLTTKGQALVPKLSALADENDKEFFGRLKPSERTLIEKLMKQIARSNGLRAIPID